MPPEATPDLPSQYSPGAAEPDLYERWRDAGVFGADPAHTTREGGDRDPFTIVIPPPNVTAVLHMGHGLNNTVQDVIIRWRRMAGDEALWVPGTDHAGIATQNVIERQLARDDGKTRFDLGREAFVERTAAFVEETGGTILRQLESIGASCDWTRTAYTLSPELSRAVREAFVHLHEKDLIYRGHRVIHWCPRCLTSLSDEEAEFSDTTGTLTHISYPLADDPSRAITVATTRPETMLGDVAVAVHPDDERYQDLIGRRVRLPIAGVEIPVIADEYTDPAFGSGAVKITPAHDANDFEVGLRHALPSPVVITPTGEMEEVAEAEGRVPAALRGLDRFEARTRIVEMLGDEGRLVKVEQHQHAIRRCYRCDTVVEPRLSDQWFVRMAPLAAPALDAVRTGRIRILPERWEGVYVHWMENIRDWNISRQLWWGHRIPVWYCDRCGGEPIVSRTDVERCPTCGGAVRQDEDVLDTWFSSWLFPFSTLGWPDRDSPDLRAFYPTDVLVSAPDILFFWIARMVMAGYEFMGEAPFHTIYLHGVVRDAQHRRMSKSLGNGIDPMDVVRKYGADALRWTVVAGLGMGTDVILDPEDLESTFAPGRNFATKLWNIGRFLLANTGTVRVRPLGDIDPARLARADRWILHRLDVAVGEADEALGPARPTKRDGDGRPSWPETDRRAGLRLSEYAESARRFVWNELADWYVEAIKGRLAAGGEDGEVARAVLVHAFDRALRLLHPIVPFITEALWQSLPLADRAPDELLARASWPVRRASPPGAGEFDLVRDAVVAVRQIRADAAVPPGKVVEAVLVPPRDDGRAREVLESETAIIERLGRATVTIAGEPPSGAAAHAVLAGGTEVVVPLAGMVDVAKECGKLRGELQDLEQRIAGLAQRLGNEKFVARAPASVVEGERQRLREWSTRREQLSDKVRSLCGS
ncbi:MAG TPA: valine--tRNA ligase [Gemmatimonadaceae bacterium]|nr:valine--tRNA ligase [Gemmatimonadaceae bacterium]